MITLSFCGSIYDNVVIAEGVFYRKTRISGPKIQACHYLKLVDQQKDPMAEPFADDLASLGLDLMLQQDAFSRVD